MQNPRAKQDQANWHFCHSKLRCCAEMGGRAQDGITDETEMEEVDNDGDATP